MPKNLIFSNREARFLKELIRHKVRFMIVGLSGAALQGAPVVTQDIDLWFQDLKDPGIRSALERVKGVYLPPTRLNPPMFGGETVKLFDIVLHMHGLEGFDEEYARSLSIPLGGFNVRVLPLERIIKSKRATGRKKDRLVLPVLMDALVAIKRRQAD